MYSYTVACIYLFLPCLCNERKRRVSITYVFFMEKDVIAKVSGENMILRNTGTTWLTSLKMEIGDATEDPTPSTTVVRQVWGL